MRVSSKDFFGILLVAVGAFLALRSMPAPDAVRAVPAPQPPTRTTRAQTLRDVVGF